jgi:TrmH family RNA methyltransferase
VGFGGRRTRPLLTSSPQPGRKLVRVRTADNLYQRLETLKRNRTKRHRYGEFLVEGVRAVSQALLHRWQISAFVYAAQKPLSPWARDILATHGDAALIELPPALMAQLSEREETSELMAVAGIPPDELSRIPLRQEALVVVFDRPNNPGNLGALIRSCDALGADGLIVTGHGADVYHPHTVRGSMGSLFALPTVRLRSHQDVLGWVASLPAAVGRPQIVGGSSQASRRVDEADLTAPTILIVGNETHGLSHAYRELCDVLVQIPMQGAANSLNVACAGSILLYEAARQRRAARSPRPTA